MKNKLSHQIPAIQSIKLQTGCSKIEYSNFIIIKFIQQGEVIGLIICFYQNIGVYQIEQKLFQQGQWLSFLMKLQQIQFCTMLQIVIISINLCSRQHNILTTLMPQQLLATYRNWQISFNQQKLWN
ncbi:unnamed protein product [Paramecium octaurelia]|uniref:Uncharacterized protein n=1 Tax=Paramecium octaurelia TaxID=43137 RepID=A0A8S1XMH4_PAROT|nr:unnamed protein product [Paramecium octaurelia]